MKKKKYLILAGAFLMTAVVCFLAGGFLHPSYSPDVPSYSNYARSGMAMKSSNMMVAETAAAADYYNSSKEEMASADTAAGASSLSSSDPIQPLNQNRKLIRTVDLNVETTEFDKLLSSIQTMVTEAGGYMESSSVSGNSMFSDYDRRYSYLTARVPADKLDTFITQVSAQGNITNQSERVEDVTLQYTDVESHKKSLLVEQDRLWELMEKAESIDSIIALEQRLSEIRYQLESYESQLRTYDNQVDYSTVDISISEVQVLTPTTPDTFVTRISKGFQRNLNGVCAALINLTVWLISSIPALVVLAIVILVISIVVRRRIRHHKAKKQLPDTGSNDAED